MQVMQQAPAADRNKGAILEVLLKYLGNPESFMGNVLEIASGTGQHVTHFAQTYTAATFQPSDVEQSHVDSISAYISHCKLGNVQQPLKIDITAPVTSWPGDITAGSYDVIYNANMVHISPWSTAVGLFNFAGYLLKEGGMLITYGPYAENGVLKPDSNVQFDSSLKSRDPSWGIRDIKDLAELGRKNGITLVDKVEMPANNKTLIWKKT
ncbi:UPF0585 protein CG18661-like isoform X2 [Mya arenaria]|uniref:UPF0585 protein CG18661-like isoform X2 n=1 Tax=Mya arenaria TaxID=6604 RepID=UPI0022E8E4A0|nr:UPF0585 protein CG18661-like isoform X2 [Mya arenaria]